MNHFTIFCNENTVTVTPNKEKTESASKLPSFRIPPDCSTLLSLNLLLHKIRPVDEITVRGVTHAHNITIERIEHMTMGAENSTRSHAVECCSQHPWSCVQFFTNFIKSKIPDATPSTTLRANCFATSSLKIKFNCRLFKRQTSLNASYKLTIKQKHLNGRKSQFVDF